MIRISDPDRLALTIEVTQEMIDAGVRVLRDSGRLEYETFADSTLVAEVLEKSLAARLGTI